MKYYATARGPQLIYIVRKGDDEVPYFDTHPVVGPILFTSDDVVQHGLRVVGEATLCGYTQPVDWRLTGFFVRTSVLPAPIERSNVILDYVYVPQVVAMAEVSRERSPQYARERARAKNESKVPPAVLPPPGFAQPSLWRDLSNGCICRVGEFRPSCPTCGLRARFRGDTERTRRRF